MPIYCGPRRVAAVDDLPALERAGWCAELKEDGVFAELWIGAGGRVVLARYRSGARVGDDSARDVMGLRTGWPGGTIVAGELHVQTPASRRWQDANGGLRGFTAFDVVAWGDIRGQLRQLAAGTLGAAPLPARDLAAAPYAERRAILERLVGDLDGRAARVIRLVRQRRRGLASWFRELVDQGHEGIVCKSPAGTVGKGVLKCKRHDSITARVVDVRPDERTALLDWGARLFRVSLPRFELGVGDLVDVRSIGFGDDGAPRHAAILRLRPDLG